MTTTTWVPAAPETFGERITLARRQLGWSVERMARRLGVKASTLATWEKGVAPRTPTEGELARRYEQTIGIDRNWLLWGEPSPDSEPKNASDLRGSESRWFPTSPGQRPRRKRRRGEKHIDLAKRQRPVKVMLTAA